MFKFRLQRVLELRAEAEQAKAQALASARNAADDARRVHAAVADLHDASRAEVHAAHHRQPRIGHLQQLGLVVQSIEERLDSAVQGVYSADVVVAHAQQQLESAARDRRVLDRLKERHADAWRVAEGQKDRLHMDEIALSRFARLRSSQDHASSSGSTDVSSRAPHNTEGTNS